MKFEAIRMKNLIIGKSKIIQDLLKTVQRLGTNRKDVLIIGEPGVGKGTVGRSIYAMGKENDGATALLSLDLSAVDEKELDSLLAGFRSGDPSSPKKRTAAGKEHGSLMLIQQIEKAGFLSQTRISKFIDEHKPKKVRGAKKIDGGIRFIVTMNEDPDLLVRKRELLEELRSTLKGFEVIFIPPLRDHSEDISMLVNHFKESLCEELGLPDIAIDTNSLDVLRHQPWHENIGELKAVVDRCILYTKDGRFTLPPELVDEKTEVMRMLENIENGQEFVLDHSIDVVEKGIIERALQRFGHNQFRAAAFLGMTEQTLRYKLKRFGIPSSRERRTQ